MFLFREILYEKSDIKIWYIGSNSILNFFEKCYETSHLTNNITNMINMKIAIKHTAIRDMIYDIEDYGYTFIDPSRSKNGQLIGFKPKRKLS